MEAQIELLKQLQGIDSIVTQIEHKRSEVPKYLLRLEKEKARREQELEKARGAHEKVNEERRKMEQKLKIEIERIHKSEEKIHAIKTNKEYQAVLKEIDDIKRANSELETKILLCMEEADRIENELRQREVEHNVWVQEFEEKKREFEGEIRHSEEAAFELQKQRVEMLEKIEPPLLHKYELLRQRRQGVAVVAIAKGLCQGCNIKLPPQKFNELLKGDDTIMICPFCNRIIYFDGN